MKELASYERRRTSVLGHVQKLQPLGSTFKYTQRMHKLREVFVDPLPEEEATASRCILYGFIVIRTQSWNVSRAPSY